MMVDGVDVKAGRWTDEEHARFLEALKIYGKNWNKVHRHVKTRTSA
jgi:SHAQKYF class myb-like DNA-binding protein